ncbi:sensor histidine kinase [Anaeromyxobacter paludicola]|uniref:histidine kinase n=1 Tax=Anaeromyxobacter paludicola TaxID=2918171 RepID=A0ABM7X6D5_9BACT|nr:ATP-binding protein [Anaeromyxobacter paludicola]BDG07376.1 two-component sensor histidine kinase [Anaeromyxobacter paludicola]
MAQEDLAGEPRPEPVRLPPEPHVEVTGRHELHAIGSAIPWRHRLSTKLLGITAGLTLAAIAGLAYVELEIQKQRLDAATRSVALFSETIKSATRQSMLDDQRPQVYQAMQAVGRMEGIEKVRMMNKEGGVTFSSDESEIGRVIDKKAEACYACHAAGQPIARVPQASRARIYQAGEHRVMGMVSPIYNEPSCWSKSCHAHSPGQQLLGVIDVGVSLAEVDTQVMAFRRGSLALTGVIVLCLAVFFYFFARIQVVQPVAALVHATRQVATDQLDVELRIDSRGELGLLAASFNDMTRELRRAEGDLHRLMGSLEHEVEERTAALKSAQAQLIQSEKLSSLGRLSASIAHEINNPLAGILTFSKLLIRTLEQGPPNDATRRSCIKNLALVQRETERCSAIVRNLLDFARERPLALKEVDVNKAVEECVQLLGHQFMLSGMELAVELGPVPMVEADFGQLRQAFVNVSMNACEAMARGGKLVVRTQLLEQAHQVEVSFCDTGPGIRPEHLAKIFDPFFTTKESGTGLGLSVVYGIVQRHHGHVEVKSDLGKGTCIHIRLPAMEARKEA